MSIAGATLATGVVLLFMAVVCSMVAADARNDRPLIIAAWVLAGVGAAFSIASAWIEALSTIAT